MSFGFGVGDFLAVGELAWALYKDVYLVAQSAPAEVERLKTQLGTLKHSIEILQEDFKDTNSVVQKAGPERLQIAVDIVSGMNETLLELNGIVEKYKKKFDRNRSKLKRGWDKVGFAITDAKEIDSIRSKIAYHNGLMNLLLTASGNSSLKRLEESHTTIEKGINMILSHTGVTQTPIISNHRGMDDEVLNASLSALLLENAESERSWASIGLFEWLQAGTWWLMKYQADYEIFVKSKYKQLPQHTYLKLIKSAWILTDLVVLHPQRNHLDKDVSREIQLLTIAIRGEFQKLDSMEVQIPNLEDVEEDNLVIWEDQKNALKLTPGQRRKEKQMRWNSKDDHLIYQSFAAYNNSNASYQSFKPCLVLFLLDKKTKRVRLVAHDQTLRGLMEFSDSALSENCHLVSFSRRSENIMSIDCHNLAFASKEELDIFRTILITENHYIRPFSSFLSNSEITHYTFFIIHALLERSRPLLKHFTEAKTELPDATREERELQLEASVSTEAAKVLQSPEGFDESLLAATNSNTGAPNILIHHLLSSGFAEIAKQLLSIRNVTFISESLLQSGLSPRLVLGEKNANILRVLVESDPRIIYEYTNEDPDNLLCLAISLGLVEEVKILADAHRQLEGIEPALTRLDGVGKRTALSWLCENWNRSTFDLLFSGYQTYPGNVGDKEGSYPIHHAAAAGNTEGMELLLRQNPSHLNIVGSAANRTPLMFAASNGQAKAVRLLLSHPDLTSHMVNEQDHNRNTALINACGQGHLEVVKFLLAYPEIDANIAPINGSALMAAAKNGHVDIVKLLLSDKYVDPDVKTATDFTALIYAAKLGYESICRLLFPRTKYTKDCRERCPLSHASENGYEGIVRFFVEECGIEPNSLDRGKKGPLLYAVENKNALGVVRFLLSRPNVDLSNKLGLDATPLMLAAEAGNVEAVRLLLERKDLPINWQAPRRPHDKTALMKAVVKGHEDIVELLIKRDDLDVNMRDKDMKATALHYAATGSEKLLSLLLTRKDIDPTIKNDYGKTPLDKCQSWDRLGDSKVKERMIKMLQDAEKDWERRRRELEAPASMTPKADVKTEAVSMPENLELLAAAVKTAKQNVIMVENATPISIEITDIHIPETTV